MTLIVDSSFLVALYNARDARHAVASAFATNRNEEILVPNIYMLRRDLGYPRSMNFLDFFKYATVKLEPVQKSDLDMVKIIAAQYADARLDLVDCCIMAISERVSVSRIATFDRRDFGIFKTRQGEHLDLLPLL